MSTKIESLAAQLSCDPFITQDEVRESIKNAGYIILDEYNSDSGLPALAGGTTTYFAGRRLDEQLLVQAADPYELNSYHPHYDDNGMPWWGGIVAIGGAIAIGACFETIICGVTVVSAAGVIYLLQEEPQAHNPGMV